MPKITYSQIVELQVPNAATGQRFGFQDQPQLRNKQIAGLEILNREDMTHAPSGYDVITAAQMRISYLTLFLVRLGNKESIGEQINQMPLTLLHRAQLNTTATNSPYVMTMFELDSYIVSWDKSYISTGTTFTAASNVSFLLNVYYK